MTATAIKPAAAPESASESLKAICPRKALADAVSTAGQAVSGRNPLPILSNLLLRSEPNGLRVIATDLEIGISCFLSAQIEEGGALAVPAKAFSEILTNLPDKSEVSLSVDKGHTTHVNSEKSKFKLLGLPAEEYPNLPEIRTPVSFTVGQATLRTLLQHVLFAVGQDEARPILTGVLFAVQGDTLKMVATDTHRLAVIQTTLGEEVNGGLQTIVPARCCQLLLKHLSGGGDVRINVGINQIEFALSGEQELIIVSRLIEGTFPNYQRVIPASHSTVWRMATEDLRRAVRRIHIVSRENANRVVMQNDALLFTLTGECQTVGNAREELDVTTEGGDMAIAFNAKYLLDVLSVIDAPRVRLELTEPLKPGVLRMDTPDEAAAEGDKQDKPDKGPRPNYLCVLMPMQIV